MNLGQIRDAGLERRAWELSSDTAKARATRAVVRAYTRFVTDCPRGVTPRRLYGQLHPEKNSATEGFKANVVSGDPWVLEFQNSVGYTGIATDGTWNGLYYIEIKDSAGRWHPARQCLDFWVVSDKVRVSLIEPWGNPTATNLEWRLSAPWLWMPAHTLSAPKVTVWDSSNRQLSRVTRARAWGEGLVRWQDDRKGPPEDMWPDEVYQVPAPNRAPICTQAESNWVGPVNRVKATFKVTRCLGHQEFYSSIKSGSGLRKPLFESSPSPASAVYDGTDDHKAIDIKLVDDDFQWSYGPAGLARENHSGWYFRLYLSIEDVATTAASGQSFNNPEVEAGKIYYLLDEVPGSQITYTWSGNTQYDMRQRLQQCNGYHGWRVYPHPDQSYFLEMLSRVEPDELVNDADAPVIQAWAVDSFLVLVESEMAKLEQNHDDARDLLAQYMNMELPKLTGIANKLRGGSVQRGNLRRRYKHPLDGQSFKTV